MLMHSMTSQNKYALRRRGNRRGKAESIDPYLNFYFASDAIILSRDGHHVLSVVKQTSIMSDPSEDPADIQRVFCGLRRVSFLHPHENAQTQRN